MKPLVKIETLFDINQIVNNAGLFSYLSQLDLQSEPVYPLISDFINQNNFILLDEDYFIGHSAEKYFSPLAMKLIKKICDDNSIDYEKFLCGTLSYADKQTIIVAFLSNNDYGFGDIVYQRFGSKWKHIWDALNTAYNPLENYSMLEERTPDITKTTNGTGSTSTDSQTGIFGFNSSQSNPSGTIDGNQTDTITDRTETETGTETLERSGNIGVTTSQQMLQSEFEVRKYDFYKEIYKDIDSILCLKIY